MKKRMSILAVLVLAVTATAYFVSGTYAKYTSNADVSGSAQVAKWNVTFTDGSNTITDGATFSLGRTADTGVSGDTKIAPGTTGSFTFGVNAADTEVAFVYGISFTVENKPTYLKFYSDSEMTQEITATSGVYTVTANTNVAATDTVAETKTVYWKWVFEDETDATANDATDTTEGIAAATMTVNASLTATQLDVAA